MRAPTVLSLLALATLAAASTAAAQETGEVRSLVELSAEERQALSQLDDLSRGAFLAAASSGPTSDVLAALRDMPEISGAEEPPPGTSPDALGDLLRDPGTAISDVEVLLEDGASEARLIAPGAEAVRAAEEFLREDRPR